MGLLFCRCQLKNFILQTHNQSDNEYICSICGNSFINGSTLNRHYRKTHKLYQTNQNSSRTEPKSAEQKSNEVKSNEIHKCDQCPEIFETEQELINHLQSIHNIEIFSCTQCNSFFRKKLLFQRHIAKNHHFRCKRCLLKCYSEEKLVEHSKTHENDPMRFICRHCARGFHRSTSMVRHLMVCICKYS